MTRRSVSRALTVTALTCGVAATAPGVLRAHDHDHDNYIHVTSPKYIKHTEPKPVEQTAVQAVEESSPKVKAVEESSPKIKHSHHEDNGLPKGHVTLVGCFIRTTDSDGDSVRFVLSDAVMGPATTVADQNCAASGTGQLIRLKHVDDVGLDRLASGRWIETFGELGSPKDADDMRKFEVKSFREVPLTPQPRIAILMVPQPAAPAVETPPAQEQAVTESPKPIATAGETPMEPKLPKTASELPLVGLLGLFAISGGLALSALNRSRVLGRD